MKTYQRFVALGEVGDRGVTVRETDDGHRVANFQLRTTRNWRDDTGKACWKTEWHRIVAWNPPANVPGPSLADIADDLLQPGDFVFVDGRVEYRSYDRKRDDGTTERVWVTEVIATELIRATDDRPFEDDAVAGEAEPVGAEPYRGA